jgi:hypothetical protein
VQPPLPATTGKCLPTFYLSNKNALSHWVWSDVIFSLALKQVLREALRKVLYFSLK